MTTRTEPRIKCLVCEDSGEVEIYDPRTVETVEVHKCPRGCQKGRRQFKWQEVGTNGDV